MAPSHGQGGDRLSALPNTALKRVLSHLKSDQAGGTSGLPGDGSVSTRACNAFHPVYKLLGQWVTTAATSGVEDLDVELRYTRTQRHIFGCPRCLRPDEMDALPAEEDGHNYGIPVDALSRRGRTPSAVVLPVDALSRQGRGRCSRATCYRTRRG